MGTFHALEVLEGYKEAVSEPFWGGSQSPDLGWLPLPSPTVVLNRLPGPCVHLTDKTRDLPTHGFVQAKRANSANTAALLLVMKRRGHS